MRLLAEAEVGEGLILNEVTRQVAKSRSGVKSSDVAKEIVEASKAGAICLNDGTMLDNSDIANLLSHK